MSTLSADTINDWADNKDGPVALHLKQKLVPVEGEGGVIFPPTYADIGYNIDTLSDGTRVAIIDSVGAQANRIEPVFKDAPYADLVPQIKIEISKKDESGREFSEQISILDLAHRSADSVVFSSPTLALSIVDAFSSLKYRGDAGPLCQLAPTSLLFGVWDSRGGSGEKRPRLIRSIIRAWDIQPLHAAAQFNSIWKSLDSEQQLALEKEAKAKKTKPSEKGFADAPAIFRKVSQTAAKHIHEYINGLPNPERRILGGVLTNGRIERDITINLVALRRICGDTNEKSIELRRYMLALALISATTDIDLFLREGCNLRYAEDDVWNVIPRRGSPVAIDLTSDATRSNILKYAMEIVVPLKKNWPKVLVHKFDLNEAKKLFGKKTDEEEGEA